MAVQDDINIKEVCRHLRRNSTEAEKVFWQAVRNRKVKNRKFTRQYPIRFEYDGQNRFFIADFYCHECKLVVEIDGGIHETQREYDKLRTGIINQSGLRVIRFTNERVINSLEKVIEQLKTWL
ncbi:MAG: DUF559 domain-containing protein [Simkaniaceae bacterium]|nr:DUF559 domain-containing protein [Simkaniaceae bacterium]